MLMEHNYVLRLDKLDDNESRLIDSCCMQHQFKDDRKENFLS